MPSDALSSVACKAWFGAVEFAVFLLMPMLCVDIEIRRSAFKSWSGRAHERAASPIGSHAERSRQEKKSGQ